MSIDDFIKEISDLLEDIPPQGLHPDTDFKGLKSWDSLAVLTVTDSLEMEFGVLLSKKDYHNSKTLKELYDLLCSRKRG